MDDVVEDGVVVVVLVLVVVVVAGWQTEMFTVVPCATRVPLDGLWLSTCPGDAPLAQVASVVGLGDRP